MLLNSISVANVRCGGCFGFIFVRLPSGLDWMICFQVVGGTLHSILAKVIFVLAAPSLLHKGSHGLPDKLSGFQPEVLSTQPVFVLRGTNLCAELPGASSNLLVSFQAVFDKSPRTIYMLSARLHFQFRAVPHGVVHHLHVLRRLPNALFLWVTNFLQWMTASRYSPEIFAL